jgi:hypothetical protein
MEATLKLITLAPLSWTIEKTENDFGVSMVMVNKAWKLKKEKGILPHIIDGFSYFLLGWC